ncbi:MAG: hypothetical protein MZV64_28275 [Ignavibacteriales bacterium]|nr:hypothetical protein [Ignavibacteriales bacterium]
MRRPRHARGGALSLHLDLNLLRLGFLANRELDGQHAVLVVRRHLRGVHRGRQREGPAERAVGPLDAMAALLLDRAVHLLLTTQGEACCSRR